MSKTVSVIITCYNLEAFIASAIDSVLNQSYKGDTEIIVVDDASIDNSIPIICSYNCVKLIRNKKNQGVLLSTIQGITNSSGEIIMFLDGDDIWDKTKISEVVNCFDNNDNVALVTHDLMFINEKAITVNIPNRVFEFMSNFNCTQYNSIIREGILNHKDYVWLGSAYSVNRRLGNIDDFCEFVKCLPDPENTYQDWPLAYWVASQPQTSLMYVNKKLFSYRLHGKNHSGDSSTLSYAVRNLTRTRNTIHAMRTISSIHGFKSEYISIDTHFKFQNFLLELYTGIRHHPTFGYLEHFKYCLKRRILLKELFRLFLIKFIGAGNFTKALSITKRLNRILHI